MSIRRLVSDVIYDMKLLFISVVSAILYFVLRLFGFKVDVAAAAADIACDVDIDLCLKITGHNFITEAKNRVLVTVITDAGENELLAYSSMMPHPELNLTVLACQTVLLDDAVDSMLYHRMPEIRFMRKLRAAAKEEIKRKIRFTLASKEYGFQPE